MIVFFCVLIPERLQLNILYIEGWLFRHIPTYITTRTSKNSMTLSLLTTLSHHAPLLRSSSRPHCVGMVSVKGWFQHRARRGCSPAIPRPTFLLFFSLLPSPDTCTQCLFVLHYNNSDDKFSSFFSGCSTN